MLKNLQITLPIGIIGDYCRQNGIKRLSVFGSALRSEFTADSDVDLLVEFEAGATVGYFRLAAIQEELSTLVGRKVDLLTKGAISQYFRDDVLAAAQVIYEARPIAS